MKEVALSREAQNYLIGEAAGAVKDVTSIGKDLIKGAVKTVTNLKKTDNVLIRTRDAITGMFGHTGTTPKKFVTDALVKNKLTHNDIPNQKVGASYDPEWKRLWEFVYDAFNGMGRPDLGENFRLTVPIFKEEGHPIDYIATLLKGAGSKTAVAAANNDYAVLLPFKSAMSDALVSQGVAAPSGMEDLTQLFYNTFVAKKGGDYEPVDFYEMSPSDAYHVDETVISAVLTYVKGLSDRKASGEQLSKVQDKIATAGLVVQDKLREKVKDQAAQEIGLSLLNNPTVVIALAVAVIIIIGLFFFKK